MFNLFKVAHEVGLEVIENASLPDSTTGLFVRKDRDCTANLSNEIFGFPSREKVTLATCIGSHLVIPYNEAYVPCYYDDYRKNLTASRLEYKRRRKAVEIAISSDKLLEAITTGLEEVWELADHFGVDEDFMAFRMAVWEKSGR